MKPAADGGEERRELEVEISESERLRLRTIGMVDSEAIGWAELSILKYVEIGLNGLYLKSVASIGTESWRMLIIFIMLKFEVQLSD
jgi:hypothetical protein